MGVFFSPLDTEYFLVSDGNRRILVFWERRYLSLEEMYWPMLSTSLSRYKTFPSLHKVQLLPSPKERSVLSPQISSAWFRSSASGCSLNIVTQRFGHHVVHYFAWLNNIPQYGEAIIYLPIPLLMDVRVASSFRLFWIKQLWIFLCKSLWIYVFISLG